MYPVKNPFVTNAYGVPNTRYAAGHHTGTDYAAATRDTIRASAEGVVTYVQRNADNAYGLHIIIRTSVFGRDRYHLYAHLSKIRPSIKVGTKVNPGRLLGSAGRTGNATGVHLHYEERLGRGRYGDDVKPVLHKIRNAPQRLKGWK